MTIDVIVEDSQLLVLAGPQVIELQTDVGPTGRRGSLIFMGAGTPSNATLPPNQTIQEYDAYIDTSTKKMFQFEVKAGGGTWVEKMDLTTTVVGGGSGGSSLHPSPSPSVGVGPEGTVLATIGGVAKWVPLSQVGTS